MTLIEFLLARIAEQETAARSRNMYAAIHFVGCYYYDHTLDAGRFCDCDQDGNATRAVLAECEAKRQIVAAHGVSPDPSFCATCDGNGPNAQGWPCDTLRFLVLPYADHPDYDTTWRP